ncbi:MAG: alanine racemase [Candidatus Onthomonas sp.]
MTQDQIAQLAGQYTAPTYVFDIGALRRRMDYLRARLPARVALCYAIKANTFLTREMDPMADRFEVCSPGEYRVCEALEIPGEKLVISGVYKTPSFIRELVDDRPEIGVFTAESPEQFRLLCEAARAAGHTVRVLLRLTSGNQFGMDEQEVRRIVRDRASWPEIDLLGIQYFSGTQKSSLKKLKRELTYLDTLLAGLETEYGFAARELEYGPGFPVHYFQGETFDEDAFLAGASQLLEELHFSGAVTLELGRSIAACCGTYLTRVVDCKRNKGENYAILDGGMNHLVYFGQMMAMKLPHYQLFPPREPGGEEVWNLCGALCTTNDILVKQLPVKDLQIGDLFVFENTGAYCMTEGISLFLSRALPKVVLLLEDGTFLPVRSDVNTYPLNTPDYERK